MVVACVCVHVAFAAGDETALGVGGGESIPRPFEVVLEVEEKTEQKARIRLFGIHGEGGFQVPLSIIQAAGGHL